MHSHLPRDMREDFHPVVELHPKGRIRERISDDAVDFNGALFRHNPVSIE